MDDKERSDGAQPPVRAPKARSYGTGHSLHDRAGTFASLLYTAEKPSVCPSVRPHFLVEWIFAVDARIHVKLARNEAPVFWEHKVCFYNVLTPCCGGNASKLQWTDAGSNLKQVNFFL